MPSPACQPIFAYLLAALATLVYSLYTFGLTSRNAPLQAALRQWVAPLRLPGDTRLQIDIDPQSFW